MPALLTFISAGNSGVTFITAAGCGFSAIPALCKPYHNYSSPSLLLVYYVFFIHTFVLKYTTNMYSGQAPGQNMVSKHEGTRDFEKPVKNS